MVQKTQKRRPDRPDVPLRSGRQVRQGHSATGGERQRKVLSGPVPRVDHGDWECSGVGPVLILLQESLFLILLLIANCLCLSFVLLTHPYFLIALSNMSHCHSLTIFSLFPTYKSRSHVSPTSLSLTNVLDLS